MDRVMHKKNLLSRWTYFNSVNKLNYNLTSIAFFNCLSLNAERALRLLSTDSGTAGSLFGALQKQNQYEHFHWAHTKLTK